MPLNFPSPSSLRTLAPYQRNRMFAIVGGVFLLIIIVVGLVAFRKHPSPTSLCRNITLSFWDVIDNEDIYRPLVNAYHTKNPCVTIEYKNMRKERSGESIGETYRKELTDALAAGSGPDMYVIHNSWLSMERERLISVTEAYLKGASSAPSPFGDLVQAPPSEKGTNAPPTAAPNPSVLISQYPDVVRFDFTRDGPNNELFVYALPISIDTLALYYNTDYFNSHNFLAVPQTWDEFIDYVKAIRRTDATGTIVLSGAAFGASDTHGVIKGGDNVNAAADIATLLMLQTGAEMNDPATGRVQFDYGGSDKRGEFFYPGSNAFQFYTSFANPKSENYTWDPNGIFSIDAFSNGTAGMMVTYASQKAVIREKNPHLNFAVGPLPQPKDRFDKVNYASYWGYAVAKKSQNPDIAWDFIQFITQKEQAMSYIKATGRPPALKELIPEYQNDSELRVFANQILTAKSWLRRDPFEAERILQQALKDALTAKEPITTILNNAANKINRLGNPLF